MYKLERERERGVVSCLFGIRLCGLFGLLVMI